MIIKNGLIHDAVNREPYIGDIRIVDGKITEIGTSLAVEGDEQIVDASGLSVYPGFVEAHCHLGLDLKELTIMNRVTSVRLICVLKTALIHSIQVYIMLPKEALPA